MREWAGPDETLDTSAFERLYRGSLLLESKVRRVRGATLLVLTGRLGLSLDEALHCHEGWIDWTDGVVRIPEKDPCACGACWDVARERRTHTEPVTDALYEECWSPPESRTARAVPFGWSPRATAALSTCFDRWDVLDLSPDEARTLLAAAARKANDLDHDDVRPGVLAPSAARFLTELGLAPGDAGAVLGVSPRVAAAYAPDDADPSRSLARLAGTTDDETDPANEFPVACGTDAYPAEPFDLDDVDAATLADRGANAPDPDRVPRETDRPESVSYDAKAHLQADTPTRREGATDDAAAAGSVTADQSSPPPASGPGSSGEEMPDLDDIDLGEMEPEPPADAESDAPADPASADGGSATASQEESASSPGPAEPAPDSVDQKGDATGPTPRNAVSHPVVADVSTRVAGDGLCGGREVDGRVVLGQEELFVVRCEDDGSVPDASSAPHVRVPLSTVWDVTVDAVPRRLDASFRRTVTVVSRPDGEDRHALAIQLPPSQRIDLTQALYRLLLNVTPMSVTNPARVAGRVTDADPERMVMYVRPGRLAFADEAGESLECAFDLDDVVHVDRTERDADGASRPVVEVRHVTGNRPVTTDVTTPDDRLRRLVWRYVRLEYHQTLTDVQDLRLSDSEKMILIALYSTDGTPDLDSILGLDDQELDGALQSLAAKDLIRSAEASTELTGRGQLVVSDRLDSVND